MSLNLLLITDIKRTVHRKMAFGNLLACMSYKIDYDILNANFNHYCLTLGPLTAEYI